MASTNVSIKLEPVPSQYGILMMDKESKISQNWLQWFVHARNKINAITGVTANIAEIGSPAEDSYVTLNGDTWGYTSVDTGVTAGSYGDATHVAQITIGADGRVSSAANVAITGGGGGSSFDPSQLFTASVTKGAWYEPNDITTLFQDTGGTTPVTTAGQSVALMQDKSGLGFHATQATVTNQPTYQVDSLGYGYLSFASGDYMDCGSAFNTDPVSACTIAVTTTQSTDGDRILDARGTGVAGTVQGWYIKTKHSGSDLFLVDDGSGNYILINDPGVSTNVMYSYLIRYTSTLLRYGINGQAPDLFQTNTSIGSIASTATSRIGASSSSSTTQNFIGSFYGAIVVGSFITWKDSRNLLEYMSSISGF